MGEPILRVYECTLYERPKWGDPRPVEIGGEVIRREYVAKTSGKARYSALLEWREWSEDVSFADIRVRSLSGKSRPPMVEGWQRRVETANAAIRIMASFGRRFFSEDSDRRVRVENPFIAHFSVGENGELWFVDRYSRKPILVRHQEWPGFSEGGTLRGIVQHLADHIEVANPINPGYFMRRGKIYCGDGDVWGYGSDMEIVEREIKALLGDAGEHASPEVHACPSGGAR